MLTNCLQKFAEETDHFGEFQLRGKTYFCSFGYSNDLYSAGAYDNTLVKQSKKTPKRRTKHRRLCHGKYQASLPSPVTLSALLLRPRTPRRGCAAGAASGLPRCSRSQWLRLPLLGEARAGEATSRAGSQRRSLPVGDTGNSSGGKGN